ncbi:MAG TPA: hypothetical protein VGC79_34215 [Polyangiaceae bacterium]
MSTQVESKQPIRWRDIPYLGDWADARGGEPKKTEGAWAIVVAAGASVATVLDQLDLLKKLFSLSPRTDVYVGLVAQVVATGFAVWLFVARRVVEGRQTAGFVRDDEQSVIIYRFSKRARWLGKVAHPLAALAAVASLFRVLPPFSEPTVSGFLCDGSAPINASKVELQDVFGSVVGVARRGTNANGYFALRLEVRDHRPIQGQLQGEAESSCSSGTFELDQLRKAPGCPGASEESRQEAERRHGTRPIYQVHCKP